MSEKNPSLANLETYPPEADKRLAEARLRRANAIAAASAVAAEAIPVLPTRPPWPEPLGDAAFHGLAGELVRFMAPHTEADEAALLLQLLTLAGVVIGPGPFFEVEADQHPARLFVVLVGDTSKARKGTSLGIVRRPLKLVDQDVRFLSGLSSGEGLIWQVRDPIRKRGVNPKTKEIEEVLVDEGIRDKRLLVAESEFAQVLRVVGREGNSLSAVVRDAWDRGDLAALTKNSPARATGAHISIIGHITRDELRRDLDRTDAASGFGNRFLWACVRRSKLLPDGGDLRDEDLRDMARDLSRAVDCGTRPARWMRNEEARELWHQVYGRLSEGRPGLLGAVTSRAEAQVVRLSLLYALLDAHPDVGPVIERAHLEAALELWRYCEASARHIFGESLGDPKADEALTTLRAAGCGGLTRTELATQLFGKHHTRGRIARVLDVLVEHGLAHSAKGETNGAGRPAERWVASEFAPETPIAPCPACES